MRWIALLVLLSGCATDRPDIRITASHALEAHQTTISIEVRP